MINPICLFVHTSSFLHIFRKSAYLCYPCLSSNDNMRCFKGAHLTLFCSGMMLEWGSHGPRRRKIISKLVHVDHIKLFIFRCVVKSVTFREWTRRLYRGPDCNSSISSETICVSSILAYEVVNMGWASLYMGHT